MSQKIRSTVTDHGISKDFQHILMFCIENYKFHLAQNKKDVIFVVKDLKLSHIKCRKPLFGNYGDRKREREISTINFNFIRT